MHLPRRSVKSIQPLPSIYTAFPVNSVRNSSSERSGKTLIRRIEDGIELVPIECSNTLSAPILSPDQAEKEVLLVSTVETGLADKPLPTIPATLWAKLSLKQRILAILAVQIATLLTVGLALMAARHRSPSSDLDIRTDSTEESSSPPQTMDPIPRGHFTIPVQLPQQQNSACLALTNESVAWQCASDTVFELNILPSPKDSNATMITLGSVPQTNSTIYHGHQAPDVQPVALRQMLDTALTEEDGPVYNFRTTYNRVVLLKQNDLTPADRPRPQPAMRHPTFQSGETLWRCTFSETVIEGYLYLNKNTTATDSSSGTRNGGFNGTAVTVQDLPKIPHVLKLVEQRMPNGNEPYCDLMMLVEGRFEKIRDGEIRHILKLAEPVKEIVTARGKMSRSVRMWKRQQEREENFCRCQWMVQ